MGFFCLPIPPHYSAILFISTLSSPRKSIWTIIYRLFTLLTPSYDLSPWKTILYLATHIELIFLHFIPYGYIDKNIMYFFLYSGVSLIFAGETNQSVIMAKTTANNMRIYYLTLNYIKKEYFCTYVLRIFFSGRRRRRWYEKNKSPKCFQSHTDLINLFYPHFTLLLIIIISLSALGLQNIAEHKIRAFFIVEKDDVIIYI